MPTYTYRCQNCDYSYDAFQRITEEPIKICPQCQTPLLKRLIGAGAGFIFKGSGFYITDYRSKEYREKSSREHETVSSSSGSESKPKKSTS